MKKQNKGPAAFDVTAVLVAFAAGEIRALERVLATARDALEMVRDADADCRKDGLPSAPAMPSTARAFIDKALADINRVLADPNQRRKA